MISFDGCLACVRFWGKPHGHGGLFLQVFSYSFSDLVLHSPLGSGCNGHNLGLRPCGSALFSFGDYISAPENICVDLRCSLLVRFLLSETLLVL